MLRIDFYVKHLIQHKARGIELRSGSRVSFHLPDGERQSSKPIDHAALVQMVEEVAPLAVLGQLRSAGSAQFAHDSQAGLRVRVELKASSPTEWIVRLAPAGQAPPRPGRAQPQAQPSPAVSPAAVAPSAPSKAVSTPEPESRKAPPVINAVPGEPKINHYLRVMKAVDASDLHLSTGVAPMARIHGEMALLAEGHAPLEEGALRSMLLEITPPPNKKEFIETSDTDFAHTIEGLCRFRANIFADRKGPGAVFRQIPFDILSVEQIGLPEKVLDLCWLSKGLVLVTGPTGSGKSTTLATMIDYINQNRTDHIITIEDPIEFVHPNKKCLINQREIGTHTKSFKSALRAALREDPDIVLVGEMRDLETIAIAIETAETGHLVFGTLHTSSAPSTVDRIIDQFPADRQEQIRVMLSESLRGVIAQVLCKKKGGGRVAGYEVLIANGAVANLIREGKTFQLKSIMQTGKKLGMQTMNDHLLQHVRDGNIESEEAYMKSNDKAAMLSLLRNAGIPMKLVKDG